MPVTANALAVEQMLVTPIGTIATPDCLPVEGYPRFAAWLQVNSETLTSVVLVQSTDDDPSNGKTVAHIGATRVGKYGYVLEVDPAVMDVANGYTYLGLDNGLDAIVTHGVYIQYPAQYAKLPVVDVSLATAS